MKILYQDEIRGLTEVSHTTDKDSIEWELENPATGLKLTIWGYGTAIIEESIAEALEWQISTDCRDIEAIFNATIPREDGTILQFQFEYPSKEGGYRFEQEARQIFELLKAIMRKRTARKFMICLMKQSRSIVAPWR